MRSSSIGYDNKREFSEALARPLLDVPGISSADVRAARMDDRIYFQADVNELLISCDQHAIYSLLVPVATFVLSYDYSAISTTLFQRHIESFLLGFAGDGTKGIESFMRFFEVIS